MTNITEGSLITDNPLEHVITRGCTSGVITHGWVALGQPSTTEVTGRLDLIAAEIEKAYFMVPRTELPKTDVIKQAGRDMVDVDGADSLWHVAQDPANLRRWACEYLAAAEAITAHQASAKAAEAEDAKRLDEEARELRDAIVTPDIAGHADWQGLADHLKDHYRRVAHRARELHKADG